MQDTTKQLVVQGPRPRRGLFAFGVSVHAALCLLWIIGWPIRWIFYSTGVVDDARFYTNWNWTGTGLFFLASLPGLVCCPRWDTALHMFAFAGLVFSNTLTFIGGTLVVSDNEGLMFDTTAAWSVVFLGERFVHIFIVIWVFVYAWLRIGDFAWMWQGHAYASRRICGVGMCTFSFAALLIFQVCVAFVPLLIYSAIYSYDEVYSATTLSLIFAVGGGIVAAVTFLMCVMLIRPKGGRVLE